MNKKYFIGYDLGSSSVKVAIVDSTTGENILSIHEPKGEMSIISQHANWAEQNPDDWWDFICTATRRALIKSNIRSSDIKAIGISYQMHGLVVVDKAKKPLRNSIIWCDSRAVSIGEKAFQDLTPKICINKLLNSPANFTASKLKWIKDNEPEVFEKVKQQDKQCRNE